MSLVPPASLAQTLMMQIKRIVNALAFLAVFICSYAQQPLVRVKFPAELDYKQTNTGGGIAYYDAKDQALFSIGVSPLDSNTSLYYPLNNLSTYTNFSYFTNCALVQVYFSVHSSIPIGDLLYSISTEKDALPQWKKLNGRLVKQNGPNGDYTTNIFLDPVVCPNQVFTVKLYNVKNPEVVLSQIVSTVPITKPKLFGKLTAYQTIDSTELNGVRAARKRQQSKDLETASLTTLDMQEFASANLFLNTNNSPYVYQVFLIRTHKEQTDTLPVFYIWAELNASIIRANNYFDTDKAPYPNTYNASIPMDFIRAPGSYELLVVPAFMQSSRFPSLYTGKSASLKFEVYPSRVINEADVILYSVLFLAGALVFFAWYKRRQKRKVRQQQQLAREAKLKLEAVRSQLNPHFIFNALAGIQNLMNKNETDKANEYLNAFSRITRSVVNNSTKEVITVEEEVAWLTDYLSMEQLRFGFRFTISVDEALDRHNVEIPAMLLQPFVENAVKHGIATLKETGRITVGFHQADNDICLLITDNGKGYDAGKEYSGAGLSLSKSRIALFNTIYKESPAQLAIDSSANGTKVTITLKNWL